MLGCLTMVSLRVNFTHSSCNFAKDYSNDFITKPEKEGVDELNDLVSFVIVFWVFAVMVVGSYFCIIVFFGQKMASLSVFITSRCKLTLIYAVEHSVKPVSKLSSATKGYFVVF